MRAQVVAVRVVRGPCAQGYGVEGVEEEGVGGGEGGWVGGCVADGVLAGGVGVAADAGVEEGPVALAGEGWWCEEEEDEEGDEREYPGLHCVVPKSPIDENRG